MSETDSIGNREWLRLGGQCIYPFVFNRRDVAEFAMKLPEVIPIDPSGDSDLEVVDVLARALVPNQHGLEQ